MAPVESQHYGGKNIPLFWGTESLNRAGNVGEYGLTRHDSDGSGQISNFIIFRNGHTLYY
jgi:hypothetical protein